ncbi:hypothetical protein JOQ06_028988, partial [Pogonophryne albipinna]
CVIRKISRTHLEENSTASRQGGGSAARRRPQPSSLHNCGFSDFSHIQEYFSVDDPRLNTIPPLADSVSRRLELVAVKRWLSQVLAPMLMWKEYTT